VDKVIQDLQVHRVQLEQLDLRVIQDHKVELDLKVIRDKKDKQVHKVM
jgi:hypothetical protein